MMPRGNRRGPLDKGPMTGRGAGYCAGFDGPGYMNPVWGHGLGIGFVLGCRSWGMGRGWRHWFYATGLPGWMRCGAYLGWSGNPDPNMEKKMLETHAEALQSRLDWIKKRLDEIDSENQSSA